MCISVHHRECSCTILFEDYIVPETNNARIQTGAFFPYFPHLATAVNAQPDTTCHCELSASQAIYLKDLERKCSGPNMQEPV